MLEGLSSSSSYSSRKVPHAHSTLTPVRAACPHHDVLTPGTGWQWSCHYTKTHPPSVSRRLSSRASDDAFPRGDLLRSAWGLLLRQLGCTSTADVGSGEM